MNKTVKNNNICFECGAFCCKYIFQKIEKDKEQLNKYWLHRSAEGPIVLKEYPNYNIYMIYQPCASLNLETNLCKVYEERTETCRKFPTDYWSIWAPYCELMRLLYKPNKHKKVWEK